MPDQPARTRATIKAQAMTLMARHAAIEDRGFDSWVKRAVLRREFDRLIDELELLELWEAPCPPQ